MHLRNIDYQVIYYNMYAYKTSKILNREHILPIFEFAGASIFGIATHGS